MCLSFKGQIETEEEVVSPIRIRKRWSPSRNQMVLELVRSYPKNKTLIAFWVCVCGSKVRTNVMICHSCGRQRRRRDQHHRRVSEELEKVEKECKSLKKDVEKIDKGLEEVKKNCAHKKDSGSDKPKEEGCGCAKKAEEKKSSCCKCDKEPEENCCKREKKKESRKECHCPPPTPAPIPIPQPPPQILPQPPFIPMVPGPWFEAEPKPPPPEPKPVCPIQEPPIVNVIVPEYRQKRRRHRARSPSVSSDSSVSVKSFQRMRQHVSSLGRRLWTVENHEDIRDQEAKLRRILEEERREELARERARRLDSELRRERSRGRWEEKPFWWRREFTEVEADVSPYALPAQRKEEPRFRRGRRWHHEDDRWGQGRGCR